MQQGKNHPDNVTRCLLAIMAGLIMHGSGWAQSNVGSDAAVLEMREAYRRNDTDALTRLLPAVTDHPLAPLARFWEMKPRLETATPPAIRDALNAMAGSYWEDRLRNDWLLLLGKNHDWALFEAELPRFRMNDDRQVQCYAWMLDAAARRKPADEAARATGQLWQEQRNADDGCATAAKAFLTSGHMKPETAWMRARLALEANQPKAALQAVEMLDPQWASIAEGIVKDPGGYLDDKFTALRPRTKELVTLAIVRLAAQDLPAAVQAL